MHKQHEEDKKKLGKCGLSIAMMMLVVVMLLLLLFKRWICEHYSGITIALDCFKIFYVLWAHPASFIPFIFPQWSSKPFIVVNIQRHTFTHSHSQWVCNVTNARVEKKWKLIVNHKHSNKHTTERKSIRKKYIKLGRIDWKWLIMSPDELKRIFCLIALQQFKIMPPKRNATLAM